jgi:hypothetical protein
MYVPYVCTCALHCPSAATWVHTRSCTNTSVTKHSDITCCLRNTSDSDYTLNLTIKHDVQVLIWRQKQNPHPTRVIFVVVEQNRANRVQKCEGQLGASGRSWAPQLTTWPRTLLRSHIRPSSTTGSKTKWGLNWTRSVRWCPDVKEYVWPHEARAFNMYPIWPVFGQEKKLEIRLKE